MNGKKIFVYDESMDAFSYPPSIPFNTSRAKLVKETVDSLSLLSGEDRELVVPRKLERDELEKFHTASYLDVLERAGQGEFDGDMMYVGLGGGDCPVFEGVYEYCRFAAGATVVGAERIIAGKASIAFNPSGGFHHAHADRASGFCYLNDVVLGIMKLTEAGMRVAFLDVDVHHSDGVQEAFYRRGDVMTISLHQSGMTLFPGTGFANEIGEGEGKGCSVNLPLPPGMYDGAYLRAVDEAVMPLIEAFGADVIVTELGADGLAGDPLAMLDLSNNMHVGVIERLLGFGKPILATGGGGYDVENTVRAWSLCWGALCGDDPCGDGLASLRDEESSANPELKDRIEKIVDEVIEMVKKNVFSIHGL